MSAYKKHAVAHIKDWTQWVFPVGDYRMACCDCGLVHNLQFKVFKVSRKDARGNFEVRGLLPGRVAFRVQRNNRATAAMRRTSSNGENENGKAATNKLTGQETQAPLSGEGES